MINQISKLLNYTFFATQLALVLTTYFPPRSFELAIAIPFHIIGRNTSDIMLSFDYYIYALKRDSDINFILFIFSAVDIIDNDE